MVTGTLLKITPSVWTHIAPDPDTWRMAFIELDNFLVMIDTGYIPKITEEVKLFAEKETGKSFKYLIITHHHNDHIAGTSFFKDCEIISSKSTLEIMKSKVKTNYVGKEIILPTLHFEEKYIIKDNDKEIEIVETHGHTAGSSFVYYANEQVLITGDLLFSEQFPYGGDPTADPYLWVKAYEIMIELKPAIVIPGHGPITSSKEMEIQKQYLSAVITKIEDLVSIGMTKQEIKEIENFPKFHYEVNKRRLDSLINRCYDVVKEGINSY